MSEYDFGSDFLSEWVGVVGLGFLCNGLVEHLFYFEKKGVCSDKLKYLCNKALSGLKSLNWPSDRTHSDLFNTYSEIQVFENYFNKKREGKNFEQFLSETTKNLEYIISDEPVQCRQETALKMRKFFDDFGDCCHYASRDLFRGDKIYPEKACFSSA